MALIRSLKEQQSASASNRPHSQVDATWRKVLTESGQTLFQLDTYGSDEQKATGQASQNIQVDRDTAVALIAILQKTFSI